MRLTRVYVPDTLAPGDEFDLSDGPRHHLTQVLRLAVGAQFLAFNGVDAVEARLELVQATRKSARVLVLASVPVTRESPLQTTLVQAVCNGERMDYTLQKCVELGITTVRPVYTEHGLAPLDAAREDKKLRHWKGIVVGACEQCGRVLLPRLAAPVRLADFLDEPRSAPLALLEPSADQDIEVVQPIHGALSFAIGPEGGWSDSEITRLRQAGAALVRFGPRVLRCETAGPAILSWIQARYGDLAKHQP